MGRPERDRDSKIGAHSHRQQFEAVALGDLRGERKVRRRRLVQWRNAHQARHRKAVAVAAGGEKRVGLLRFDTRFLRFAAGVYLDKQLRTARLPGKLPGERLGEACPVERVDRIE